MHRIFNDVIFIKDISFLNVRALSLSRVSWLMLHNEPLCTDSTFIISNVSFLLVISTLADYGKEKLAL